ncbi:hypothetical protein RB595_004641 [Gaeumannomyces hyphopodioides]
MNGDNYSRDGGRHGSSGEHRSSRADRDDRREDRRDRDRDRGDRERGDRDRGDRDRGDRDRDRDRTRRRSRSPDYRGGRSSRRDGGGEPDSYSMSRSHRDREREDRHGGRDRRERDWDRERPGAPRRDARRDDDDRRGDRDRGGDAYADRRGGGGGGGGGGRRGEREERRRSATPPPKKREPTPDLTDVVPILERKRRLTQWDIKPPGYDSVTAEQAKLSGMFPLPGAPRQQTMDSKSQPFGHRDGGRDGRDGGREGRDGRDSHRDGHRDGGHRDGHREGHRDGGDRPNSNVTLRPTNSRQSKRLIVTNFAPGTTEEALVAFMNLQLNGLNVIESTDPCLLCQMAPDSSFAILEFRSPAETTVALALDGITMEAEDTPMEGAANGTPQGLELRRPKDYIVPAVVEDTGYERGVVSSRVVDTPHKISIINLAPYLTEEQVTELLVSFGELKALILVKDSGTEESRGIAFCEYFDPAATDVAIHGLNNMELGDKRLRVKKASIGITQVSGIEMGINAMSMLAGTVAQDPDLSRVLQLLNMVTADELLDNDDYEEICDDVRDECSKFGTILELKIPRPSGGSRQLAGVGKIYVKFDRIESSTEALKGLAGRKFADRTVVTTYFPEENFDVGAW